MGKTQFNFILTVLAKYNTQCGSQFRKNEQGLIFHSERTMKRETSQCSIWKNLKSIFQSQIV